MLPVEKITSNNISHFVIIIILLLVIHTENGIVHFFLVKMTVNAAHGDVILFIVWIVILMYMSCELFSYVCTLVCSNLLMIPATFSCIEVYCDII